MKKKVLVILIASFLTQLVCASDNPYSHQHLRREMIEHQPEKKYQSVLSDLGKLHQEPITLTQMEKSDTPKTKSEQLMFLKEKMGRNETIDFELSGLKLSDFISIFSNDYNLNIINDATTVTKRISFSLKNVHPIDLFDMLLSSWECDWFIEKNAIRIVKQDPTRIYKLNYASVESVMNSITKVTSAEGISFHANNNTLIAKASVRELDQITRIIHTLDVQPKQVLIEAKIIETSTDLTRKLGVILESGASKTLGLGQKVPGATASGLFVQALNGNFSAYMDALETNVHSKVLASPKLLVTNHNTAKILTGERLGFKTVSVSDTGTIESVQFLETGIKLSFTPHISENDEILMTIQPEVSEGRIEDNVPRESTTQTSTQVLVKDNQSIIIGGLIQHKDIKSRKGVPLLSKLPVIKHAFTSHEDTDSNRELLILITPHIIDLSESQVDTEPEKI